MQHILILGNKDISLHLKGGSEGRIIPIGLLLCHIYMHTYTYIRIYMYDIHTDTHTHISLEKLCAFMHVALKQHSSQRCLTSLSNGDIRRCSPWCLKRLRRKLLHLPSHYYSSFFLFSLHHQPFVSLTTPECSYIFCN